MSLNPQKKKQKKKIRDKEGVAKKNQRGQGQN